MTARARPGRRAAVAALIVALHAALAVLLLAPRPAPPLPQAVPLTVHLLPVSRAPVAVERGPPLDAALSVPAFDIAADPAPAAAPCDVPAALTATLAGDPAVTAALAAAPERAVMAWNGGWSVQPGAPAIRRAVAATLAGTAAACLDEPLTGPRLAFVPVAGTTVSVAFGSGTWRWRDLLATAAAVSGDVPR